jgi:hypothetical protein
MAVPPIPPPFEELGQRPFSFFPPIVGVEHNEWRLGRATWSEVLVHNTKTNEELWVPRRFIGAVSRIDEPIVILGLLKELEYRGGAVLPYERRVIQMPRAVNDIPRYDPPPNQTLRQPDASGEVVGIRLESGEARIGRLIGAVLLVGVIACALTVAFFRAGQSGGAIRYRAVMQSELGLTSQDDYYSIVRKVGAPKEDKWLSDEGELQYRRLSYPDRGIHIILMGSERNKARYIGTMDARWSPVDSVSLPGGGSTAGMLRALKQF